MKAFQVGQLCEAVELLEAIDLAIWGDTKIDNRVRTNIRRAYMDAKSAALIAGVRTTMHKKIDYK